MTLEEAKALLKAFENKRDNSNDVVFMNKLRAQIATMEEAERKSDMAMKNEVDRWEVAENKRREKCNLPLVTEQEKMAILAELKKTRAEAAEKAQGQELREATERGRLAKQNQTFPTVKPAGQIHPRKPIIHVSPVSVDFSYLGR